ncbi:Gfo/Idh/MocA family oxidoreductase, partial [Streptomyces niveus]|uniref:Gfo/Idh/MocA family protein n=1 Tax=Streptomyces niveus TaxID=193462 RepID=UPI0034170FF9
MGEPLKPSKPLNIGIVGAGKISGAYLSTLERLTSLRLTAVTDLDPGRARAVADQAPGGAEVAVVPSVAALVARDDVDAVLNLTIPAAHADVALAALRAGKHVYGEKPLAADREEADAVLAAAREAGLRVGCAPDTVLGTGTQTARKAVDDGLIGRPVAATAFMTGAGHETQHDDGVLAAREEDHRALELTRHLTEDV